MNIVLINNRYGRNTVGGAETVVEEQQRQYRQEGHRVFVLSTERFHGWRSLSVHHDADDPVNVFRLYPLNIFSYEALSRLSIALRLFWHVLNWFNLHSMLAIRRWLQRVRPDVVITHNLTGVGYLIRYSLFSIGYSLQWNHYLHDIQLLYPSGLLLLGEEQSWRYLGWPTRLFRSLMRTFISNPDEVRSPSQWLLDEHKKFGFFQSSRCIIVKSGTTTYASDSGLLPAYWQAGAQARNNRRTLRLLFIGQLEPHKGILFLINCIKNYQLPITNYQLHIIGSGSQMEKIAALCEGDRRFVIHGGIPHKQVEPLWRSADLLIVPSLCYENAPRVLFEAWDHGVSVLASRIGGIPEFFNNSTQGALFTPGDSRHCIAVLSDWISKRNTQF